MQALQAHLAGAAGAASTANAQQQPTPASTNATVQYRGKVVMKGIDVCIQIHRAQGVAVMQVMPGSSTLALSAANCARISHWVKEREIYFSSLLEPLMDTEYESLRIFGQWASGGPDGGAEGCLSITHLALGDDSIVSPEIITSMLQATPAGTSVRPWATCVHEIEVASRSDVEPSFINGYKSGVLSESIALRSQQAVLWLASGLEQHGMMPLSILVSSSFRTKIDAGRGVLRGSGTATADAGCRATATEGHGNRATATQTDTAHAEHELGSPGSAVGAGPPATWPATCDLGVDEADEEEGDYEAPWSWSSIDSPQQLLNRLVTDSTMQEILEDIFPHMEHAPPAVEPGQQQQHTDQEESIHRELTFTQFVVDYVRRETEQLFEQPEAKFEWFDLVRDVKACAGEWFRNNAYMYPGHDHISA